MLSGWATQDAKERFEYVKSLDNVSKEELKAEVIFHKTRSAEFEREKERWRKLDQENGGKIYKLEQEIEELKGGKDDN